MSIDFGQLTGMDEADLLHEDDLPRPEPPEQSSAISAEATPLWEYLTQNTIGGIQVEEGSRGLQINSSDLLMVAMQLKQVPKVFVCWLSPEDEAGKKAYSDLLAMAGERRIFIDEETRQYDTAKSAYMVFVRYSEVSYVLHPRFEYLRSGDK